ncbi:hypothetical protein [Niabella hirudinis]|uniref:hypothetical protein n=1 Tax=Niabella hirudinis TaxID=1285929 RepID=UPI003EBD25B5
MRTILAIVCIILLAACSKKSTINPGTLRGHYSGQQQFVTLTYILIYPFDMEISLNGTSWEAKVKDKPGTIFSLSGDYTIKKDSAKFTNHNTGQNAPALLNTNYKVTVRGDSLYLENVIKGNGEIYALKRN